MYERSVGVAWVWILAAIVAVDFGLFGLALLFGARWAVRTGRRLLGWARERNLLPGETTPKVPQDPSRPARDVVVEPVEQTQAAPVSQPQPRKGYVRLDPDNGTTFADVAKVMRDYVNNPVLGGYAQGVIDTLDSADLRHQSLFVELEGTFQPGSISYDKFAGPANAGFDSILRNSAYLANRIQSFDTAGYLRLKESLERDVQNGTSGGTGARAERWKLYCEMIDSFDRLQETNESLLLELEKLSGELATLSASDPTDQSDYIIEEIRRLVEEAKYYR